MMWSQLNLVKKMGFFSKIAAKGSLEAYQCGNTDIDFFIHKQPFEPQELQRKKGKKR